ncbi:MAG TPA: phage Gp37/Gp68 family protein [Acetobacteraceae bacterium]|nr:phage Gp37/Gp68 family protein [Acetobacteraceae bacterium]
MGKNSRIEWTDHTFNPWWGCTKVSEACKHCYAEAWSKRVGQKVWGPKAERRFFTERHWLEPIKWNADALSKKSRRRVFCASMADVFEDRRELDEWRLRLWNLIEATPQLDWLLLTKRPELVAELTHWQDKWPSNVWLGTTIENQKSADSRLPHLTAIPATVRFISAEPLLGALDLRSRLGTTINWVITGGESGPKARPSSPSWFRDLLGQCMQAGVPFHFKQWGDWAPSRKNPYEKVDMTMQQADDGTVMLRVGKKAAGRLLDGEMWNGLPQARAA